MRKFLDKLEPMFAKGGKYEKLYPLFEAAQTFFYTVNYTTVRPSHIRDAVNLKRVIILVYLAAVPAMIFGWYFVGAQHYAAAGEGGGLFSNLWYGAMVHIPLYIIVFAVAIFWEVLFSVVRRHEISEGVFVTALLYSLILPPTIPIWQACLGISFGIVIGKEIFGGTGKNFVNPALAGRAFLYFAYPAQMSGEVWVDLDGITKTVDGFSGATPLAKFVEQGINADVSWWGAFFGNVGGSIGEVSTFAILIGAAIVIATGVASWRIMVGVLGGAIGTSLFLTCFQSETNLMLTVPFWWHLVIGGFAFGTVFMATDPITASVTNLGRYIYGALIGVMTILIRVVNPAFPEGIMLAILFANVFAPLIDYFVQVANVKRRKVRTNG